RRVVVPTMSTRKTPARGPLHDSDRLPGASVVLFDLDGTLADTVELILRSFRHTMGTHLGRVPPDQEWLRGLGRPLRDQMAAFASGEEERERMIATYVAFQERIHDDLVRPFPGAVDALAVLEARGIPLAVVTSKRRAMARRTLARCGFDGRLAALVTADDVRRGKPDPEPVRLALQELGGVAPQAALFAGDSPWDVRSGRAAGVITAGVTWGPYPRRVLEAEGPDFLVESWEELLELPLLNRG
ncbi:MAG: HAD-IA family hydrolase, partial [Gemmatimonadota bacterium]